MKGSILKFDIGSEEGVISGEDGCRYIFDMTQWQYKNNPEVGNKVNFIIESGKVESATLITTGKSKKLGAVLLAFFFGVLGAHKFYLGYNKEGICMLVLFVFGYVFLGLPSMVIAMIALVEFVIYLLKPTKEFQQAYVLESRPWF